MMSKTYNIQLGPFSLHLFEPILMYLGGCSSEKEWLSRGVQAHRDPIKNEQQLAVEKKAAHEFLTTSEGKKRVQLFVNRVADIFYKILCDGSTQWLDDILRGREIVWVVGALRTGGTYLYTELSQLHHIDWRSLNQGMSHDGMPHQGVIQSSMHLWSWIHIASELAQLLAWWDCECHDQKIILHKNTSIVHALPQIDAFFGLRAKYIITVRHPGPMADSIAKLMFSDNVKKNIGLPFWRDFLVNANRISAESFEKASYYKKAFLYWDYYYEIIAKQLPVNGQVDVVPFGSQMPHYINTMAMTLNQQYEAGKFYASSKDYCQDWLPCDDFQEMLHRQKKHWELSRISFPDIQCQ